MPEVKDAPERSRYEMAVGGEAAFVSYRWHGPTLVLVHTEVPASLGGQGVGSALAKGVLADLRARDVRIIPQCEFIATYIQRHPEWADLVAGDA